MALLEKKLIVKRSQLPDAGKGLFTKVFIPKGTKVVQYKGKITTWKGVDHKEGNNGYIYFVRRDYVIDARTWPSALARYANDAEGLQKVKGLRNNAEYMEEGEKVYIITTKDIPAGSEIFVEYGKEYWAAIRYNIELDRKKKT